MSSHFIFIAMKTSFIALPCLIMASLSQGAIVTGQSIEFTTDDFSSGNTAKKTVIIENNSTSAKNVWAAPGMTDTIGNNGLSTTSSLSTSAYVVWKINIPATLTISEFTWAWKTVLLTGAYAPSGDDSFAWQWSTDNINWTSFFTRANRLESDSGIVTLSNKTYTVSLADLTVAVSTLYIRATLIEGAEISSDSGFFALNGGYGTDTNTYIQMTTKPVPEAASLGIIGAGGLILMRRGSK